MELRQLEAFVAVTSEQRFGRAAERLNIAPPTLSELILRLELELGARLFTRTTRRVVITTAGAELLARAETILDDLASAEAAVRRVAGGDAGTIRLGITPPVAQTLAPHLIGIFAAEAPQVTVQLQRMWLPNLIAAFDAGDIDIGITCGIIATPAGIATEVFCAEPLLVGLRPNHRLAGRDAITLADLANDVLGITPEALFPAWVLSQRQALAAAGVAPATVDLVDTDLSAVRWVDQPGVDWILLIASLATAHTRTVVRPVMPQQLVPFTLQWNPNHAPSPAVARFVNTALTADPPPGWCTQPGHLRHSAIAQPE